MANTTIPVELSSTPGIVDNSNATAITIDSSENVGIGTGSPNVLGHFYKGSSGRTWTPDGADVLAIENNDSIVLDIRTPNSNQGLILFSDAAARGRGIVGYAHSSDHMYFNTSGAERMRIDSSGNLLFNSGYGSVATAYGCRAWVNFNGTGTVAIRASGNVSSITDLGTGDYRVNFTTAMPDTQYTQVWGAGQGSGAGNYFTTTIFGAPATSNCTVRTSNQTPNTEDSAYVTLAIFR